MDLFGHCSYMVKLAVVEQCKACASNIVSDQSRGHVLKCSC
jgi:hypothetical protein